MPFTSAPPDDGHQGAFTRPGDTLVCEDVAPAHARPALHVDTTEARPSTPSAGFGLALGAGMIVLTYVLFGVYLP